MSEQPAAPANNVMPPNNPVTPPADVAAPAALAESPLPNVPDTWPGAFGAYKYSKRAVKPNISTVVVIYLVDLMIGLLLEWKLKTSGQIITFLIGGLVTAALNLTYISGVRGQRLSIGQALSNALPFWLKMIGLNILVYLSYIISAVLLIVPLFFVAPRLALASYFLIDKKLGIIGAYKASWAATKGHVTKIYGIIGAVILMTVLMLTIIGIPFAIYFLVMYSAAFAVLYELINNKTGLRVAVAVSDPTAMQVMPAAIAPTGPVEPVQPAAAVPAEPAQPEPSNGTDGNPVPPPAEPPSLPPSPIQ
jgi:hypothetical protein